MADLLSNTDKTSFQNSVLDLFDTFSRSVTVHKEPQKNIISVDAHLLPGYEGASHPENIKYIPKNAAFKAIIKYNRKQDTETEAWAGVTIPRGEVSIKVKEETRDYFNNGRTLKVDFDNKSFKVASTDSVKDYFGMKMYVYYLEEVK